MGTATNYKIPNMKDFSGWRGSSTKVADKKFIMILIIQVLSSRTIERLFVFLIEFWGRRLIVFVKKTDREIFIDAIFVVHELHGRAFAYHWTSVNFMINCTTTDN